MVTFATDNVTILLAGAGSGKTTRLLAQIEKDLDVYRPEDIALVSFTRKGAYEGKERLVHSKNIDPERLPYFRTLHALAAMSLKVEHKSFFDVLDRKKFNSATGFNLSLFPTPVLATEADKLLAMYERWRADGFLDTQNDNFDYVQYNRFVNAYETYKKKAGKLDFTDCLLTYLEIGSPIPVKSAYIDEAQDLTDLQWKVVMKAFSTAEKIFIAGDDYQSIYTFAGARPDYLVSLASRYPTIKLDVSYRLPCSVYEVAKAITDTISIKVDKDYKPFRQYDKGEVEFISSWTTVLGKIQAHQDESWLILFRFNSIIGQFLYLLRSALIPYFYYDEFFIPPEDMRVLTRLNKFKMEGFSTQAQRDKFKEKYGIKDFNDPLYEMNMFPHDKAVLYQAYIDYYGLDALVEFSNAPSNKRITVSTIHRVKGAEANNVALFLDATKNTTKLRYSDIDSELRLLYVAVTRTKQRLYLVNSISYYGIDDIISALMEDYGLGHSNRT